MKNAASSPTITAAGRPQVRRHDTGHQPHHHHISRNGKRRQQNTSRHAALILVNRQVVGVVAEVAAESELLAVWGHKGLHAWGRSATNRGRSLRDGRQHAHLFGIYKPRLVPVSILRRLLLT